jgi:hypothetical protein
MYDFSDLARLYVAHVIIRNAPFQRLEQDARKNRACSIDPPSQAWSQAVRFQSARKESIAARLACVCSFRASPRPA